MKKHNARKIVKTLWAGRIIDATVFPPKTLTIIQSNDPRIGSRLARRALRRLKWKPRVPLLFGEGVE